MHGSLLKEYRIYLTNKIIMPTNQELLNQCKELKIKRGILKKN
jgi:hypothetical protein